MIFPFCKCITAITGFFLACSCNDGDRHKPLNVSDTSLPAPVLTDTNSSETPVAIEQQVTPDSVVSFARTLKGVPYLYASADPAKGFDCSGFITYVFNHFAIRVPRSSVDFTNFGKDISLDESKPGDLILFTGTDTAVRVVGHMGIVENTSGDTLRFIHSTSGKGQGVVITALGEYYRKRFVKVIRIFPDELFAQ